MKKLFLIPVIALSMSGCSALLNEVPSFYDDNESKGVVDVWVAVKRIDCEDIFVKNHIYDADEKLEWLMTYSEGKGSNDVLEALEVFDESLDGLVQKEQISPAYCKVKKENLLGQITIITKAIVGRY